MPNKSFPLSKTTLMTCLWLPAVHNRPAGTWRCLQEKEVGMCWIEVFGWHKKKPSTEVSTLVCLMTTVVINCYHQRADNSLGLSENVSSSVQGFFQGFSGPHLSQTRSFIWVCQKHYVLKNGTSLTPGPAWDSWEARVCFFPGS